MGKTNQPLQIVVWAGWRDRPEVQALVDKHHNIVFDDAEPDLILHPAAHRWHDTYWKHLGEALRQARRGKRAAKA